MKFYGKKALLFIEPCLSSWDLILNGKQCGYTILVITSHSNYLNLPEETLDAISSFFLLDIDNEAAVLDLVKKIALKFQIKEVIPGANSCEPITAKVLAYLNQSNLMCDRISGVHENLYTWPLLHS